MPPNIPFVDLPTLHRKYCVEAYAQWWFVQVSVMNEDGSLVSGLQKKNFRVGYIDVASTVLPIWHEVPLLVNESANGFYLLALFTDSGFFIYPDSIYTVEAFQTQITATNKLVFRGQCLA